MQRVITLNESEIGLARLVASQRTANNRVAQTKHNVIISGQDNFHNEVLGVCGEMVVAQAYIV